MEPTTAPEVIVIVDLFLVSFFSFLFFFFSTVCSSDKGNYAMLCVTLLGIPGSIDKNFDALELIVNT